MLATRCWLNICTRLLCFSVLLSRIATDGIGSSTWSIRCFRAVEIRCRCHYRHRMSLNTARPPTEAASHVLISVNSTVLGGPSRTQQGRRSRWPVPNYAAKGRLPFQQIRTVQNSNWDKRLGIRTVPIKRKRTYCELRTNHVHCFSRWTLRCRSRESGPIRSGSNDHHCVTSRRRFLHG